MIQEGNPSERNHN